MIKVGTNVLSQPNHRLDYNVIHHMVEQIGQLRREGHRVVLVTSGAAGAARGLADFSKEKKNLLRRQMMCAVGQGRLMQIYADFLREESILPAQALLSRSDFASREHYLNIRNVIEGLLDLDILPIINENDVVANDALTFGDNDYLAAGVAVMLGAHRLFLLTTARGFFQGGDPSRNPEAVLIPQVDQITPQMWGWCEARLSDGGRGGMMSKLKAAEIVSEFGIRTHVVYGKEPNVVPRLMAGESLGTMFMPTGKRPKSFHRWLRIGALTNGRVVIDDGAEAALQGNKSLLPQGIRGVEGEFRKGDIVDIYNGKEEKLGVGLINYSAEELARLLAAKEPGDRGQEAIHKDRLLLVNN
ncbi:MAG: glutamate 5-kinase [Deltaproteobacteria bacterium]|nr:glutamate 5-kinase [Deltaproteobacteria bacterium]